MSSVNNASQKIPNYDSLNDAQKKDVESIGNAAAKFEQAKGTKEAKVAAKDVNLAFAKAEKDGISKDDLKSLGNELSQSKVGNDLAMLKASGKPVDDKRATGFLVNDFQRFCKLKGLDAKKAESFDAWKNDITPDLKESGLSDDEINKALKAAEGEKNKPGDFKRPPFLRG